MARLLPDCDALLMEILRAALPAATVVEVMPPDWTKRYPLVRAYRFGGASEHPLFLDRALVQVDVYDDDRTAALNLAEDARTALYQSWAAHRVYPHGSVAHFGESQAPVELRTANQPDGETRVNATYELHICPPSN